MIRCRVGIVIVLSCLTAAASEAVAQPAPAGNSSIAERLAALRQAISRDPQPAADRPEIAQPRVGSRIQPESRPLVKSPQKTAASRSGDSQASLPRRRVVASRPSPNTRRDLGPPRSEAIERTTQEAVPPRAKPRLLSFDPGSLLPFFSNDEGSEPAAPERPEPTRRPGPTESARSSSRRGDAATRARQPVTQRPATPSSRDSTPPSSNRSTRIAGSQAARTPNRASTVPSQLRSSPLLLERDRVRSTVAEPPNRPAATVPVPGGEATSSVPDVPARPSPRLAQRPLRTEDSALRSSRRRRPPLVLEDDTPSNSNSKPPATTASANEPESLSPVARSEQASGVAAEEPNNRSLDPKATETDLVSNQALSTEDAAARDASEVNVGAAQPGPRSASPEPTLAQRRQPDIRPGDTGKGPQPTPASTSVLRTPNRAKPGAAVPAHGTSVRAEPTLAQPTPAEPTPAVRAAVDSAAESQSAESTFAATMPDEPDTATAAATKAAPPAVPQRDMAAIGPGHASNSSLLNGTEHARPDRRTVTDPFGPGASVLVPHRGGYESSPQARTVFDAQNATRTLNTTARAAADSQAIRLSGSAPAIHADLAGPRRVTVGRESTYTLTVDNRGYEDARQVVATLVLEGEVDIVRAEGSRGVVHRVQEQESAIEWRMTELAAHDKAAMQVVLIPKTSTPVEFDVHLRSAPLAMQNSIEVQEPKLELTIDGPTVARYGETKTYRIEISNPGTGVAEEIVIQATPAGTVERIAALPPGGRRAIEIKVVASQAGPLLIAAKASAAGGLAAAAEKTVDVRQPMLTIDVRGPESTYAGTVAPYFFRVQNPGTAAADGVVVAVKLPAGTTFSDASEGGRFVSQSDTVEWHLGTVRPGDDVYLELRCTADTAGEKAIYGRVQNGAGTLKAETKTVSRIEALADLRLEVIDPKGPVAVGEEAVYEIRVHNRGSSIAEQINVVALFSDGIDPIAVEGAHHAVNNGRVAFRTIDSLAAGRDTVLRIRAVAHTPGIHVFRTEVYCLKLETRLAAEETTRFYQEQYAKRGGQEQFRVSEPQSTRSRR